METRVFARLAFACFTLAACSGGGSSSGTPPGAGGGGGVPDVDVDPPLVDGGIVLPPGDGDFTAHYPERILCPADGSDPRCGEGSSPENALAPAALESALNTGLDAWHYPGEGGACASCHSPDAIELAKVGYADCDIRRRAHDHVDEARADAIVGLVHAMRQIYGVERPLHPDRYRPLQPAYEPLGEVHSDVDAVDTTLQDERDLAFMNYVVNDLDLLWAKETITSLEMAHEAYDQLRDLDLGSIRIGIPFDRLSEDPDTLSNECRMIDGPAHTGKSIFEWIPDIPIAAKAGGEAAWRERLLEYVEDPSTENLWAYYDQVDAMTACDEADTGAGETYERACEWMRLKYKSVQVLQHMLRHDTRAHPDQLVEMREGDPSVFAGDDLDRFIARTPIWETGDFIRRNPLARRPANPCFMDDAHPCTSLPARIDETIHEVPSYDEARINQGDLFRMSWTMMGFLRDPTLTTQSDRFETYVGDYLESVLLPRYDIHHAFVFTVLAVRKSAATEWFDAEGFRRGTGKLASVRTFSFKQTRGNLSPPAEDSPRYATHRLMFANFARMFIYLVEEDLRLTGTIYGRTGTFDGSESDEGGVLQAIRFLRDWVVEIEGQPDPAIDALVGSIEDLAETATELRPESDFDDYDGLQPSHRWGAGEDVNYQLPFAP